MKGYTKEFNYQAITLEHFERKPWGSANFNKVQHNDLLSNRQLIISDLSQANMMAMTT